MNKMVLCSREALNLEKTFECGQCFRWNAHGEEYRGVAYGYPARIYYRGNDVIIESEAPDSIWYDYFDLNTDYSKISESFMTDNYLKTCTEFGQGIRILRQESWEALCSFIISQCNNIKRIKGIVEILCSCFGEQGEFMGESYYSFPSAQRLAVLSPEDLSVIRCGYRAEYIINAAKAVCSDQLNLKALVDTDWRSAIKELMKIRGIGVKVANCVVLFGLYHMEAFPIDVWIRRALDEHFPKDFDPMSLGSYAGLAQQYIFYYIRTTGQ